MYNQFDQVVSLVAFTRTPGEGGAIHNGAIGVVSEIPYEVCARGHRPCYTILFADGTTRHHMEASMLTRWYPRVPWRSRAWWVFLAFAAGVLARPFLDNWVG